MMNPEREKEIRQAAVVIAAGICASERRAADLEMDRENIAFMAIALARAIFDRTPGADELPMGIGA